MKISQQILKEKSNVYIENGSLTKFRGSDILSTVHEELQSKRKSGEKLSATEIGFLKEKSNVVIENDTHIQFYNFTGFTQ